MKDITSSFPNVGEEISFDYFFEQAGKTRGTSKETGIFAGTFKEDGKKYFVVSKINEFTRFTSNFVYGVKGDKIFFDFFCSNGYRDIENIKNYLENTLNNIKESRISLRGGDVN